jgi:hypothetical protein
MSQFWENVAARTDAQHTAEEFEAAAYRLVVEQVIYYADRPSRTAYWMIERYERDFKQALAPLGITLDVNRQLRYAFAQPRHEKAGTASVGQTVLALVLRAIYDEAARIGQLNEDGEVDCDLIELEEKYRLMTGRELPTKGELDALLKSMKRWGIAKKSDDSGPEGDGAAASQPICQFHQCTHNVTFRRIFQMVADRRCDGHGIPWDFRAREIWQVVFSDGDHAVGAIEDGGYYQDFIAEAPISLYIEV